MPLSRGRPSRPDSKDAHEAACGPRPEAERDLLTARDWYEGQRAGLGDEFTEEVTAALERVAEMPEMFAIFWEDVRTCRPRRFP